MRALTLTFALLLFGAHVSAVEPPKTETIVGTIVAYDQLNNLMLLTFVMSRVVLIVRTERRGKNNARYIQVAYNYYGPAKQNEGGFPDRLVERASSWKLRLKRDSTCDRVVQEFSTMQDAQTGKDTHTRLAIWKSLPGAENEKLPYGETLPCYLLKAGDYKPYSK